jgi:NDP-sugar pyrophosphorylase family protein
MDSGKTAFVLAGGMGTRLKPITQKIPKPMAPIKGKPLLEHTIDSLKRADFTNITISVGYLKEQIMNYFGSGEKFHVNIKYATEDTPLGTGGAIKRHASAFKSDFIVVNGDNVFDFDLREIYKAHRESRPMATVGLGYAEDVSQFGVVKMEGNRITQFVEKPEGSSPPSHFVSTGVYVLSPAFLGLLPDGVSNVSRVLEKAVEKNTINGFVQNGDWFPCDNISLYKKAAREWKR